MEFSENPEEIKKWAPLIMEGRNANEKVAATHMKFRNRCEFWRINSQND